MRWWPIKGCFYNVLITLVASTDEKFYLSISHQVCCACVLFNYTGHI